MFNTAERELPSQARDSERTIKERSEHWYAGTKLPADESPQVPRNVWMKGAKGWGSGEPLTFAAVQPTKAFVTQTHWLFCCRLLI